MTPSRYRFQPTAGEDARALARHLLATTGPDAALRFVDHTRKSLERLVRSPSIGSPVETPNTCLSGLRKWRVEGFPKLLIFYRIEEDSLDIIRILHAASDWQSLFDADWR